MIISALTSAMLFGILKVIAIGDRAFVTGFVLAGVVGDLATTSSEALDKLQNALKDPDVGLIMLSDDLASPVRNEITSIRSKRPTPLIYEVPGPRSKKHKVEYRAILRQILGV
jgi:V/A-type H+-transporting ATPase subunit F